MSLDDLSARLCCESYDIFALGCIVTGLRLVRELTAIIRESNPQAVIIAGNSVASSIPELLLRNTEVDVAVMSESDITIVELLRALLGGWPIRGIKGICYLEDDTFRQNPMQDLIPDLDQVDFLP